MIWTALGASGFVKGDEGYSIQPTPDPKFLKQVVDGLNLTDLVTTPLPTAEDSVDDAELKMIKFAVMTYIKTHPGNKMMDDFLRVIKRAER